MARSLDEMKKMLFNFYWEEKDNPTKLKEVVKDLQLQYGDAMQDFGTETEEGKIRQHNLELLQIVLDDIKELPG